MKTIIFLFSLISIQAMAVEGFHCVPSARATRIQVLVQEKNVEVLVTNPMGYNFMPQFESQGTSFQISFNNMQAKDLIELAQQFSFSWPKENCTFDSEKFKVSCKGAAEKLVNSIQGLGISTTEITEKYNEDIYNKRRFRFTVLKDNTYFVSQEYDIKNCEKF